MCRTTRTISHAAGVSVATNIGARIDRGGPAPRGALLLLMAVLASATALAQHREEPHAPSPHVQTGADDTGAAAPDADALEVEVDWDDDLSITHHEITIGGAPVAYTATAGTMPLTNEEGEPRAHVFFIAYTRDGVDDVSTRPVTFTFNGGPGSSSVWLHLGAFGPRRVVMSEEGEPQGPPYELEDNEHSLLDLTDLVFIDPVTTGYSRAASGEDPKQFHGVQEDIESVGEFIRQYTSRFGRWSSPKFLAGESYGTTRAAGLSGHLQRRHGMFLNGIVLVSSILNFQTARFDRGNDLPYVLMLPTCTATAWYHGRLEPRLQQTPLREVLAEVEAFALGDYATVLLLGDAAPREARDGIADRLARYTGIDAGFIRDANERLGLSRFVKELLRHERRTVGRLDSRFKGIDADAAGDRYEYDPSYAAILGPYTAMLNHYVRGELEYESDLPYEILTGRVRPWNYGNVTNQYLNVAETLRGAMTRNPALRVFVASGYYDFATPYFASDFTFNHLGLDPLLQDHVTIRYYEAGHMMYIHLPSLRRLKADLAGFFDEATSGPPVRF